MRKVLHSIWKNKMLLMQAAFWLWVIRLGLWILPFATIRDWTIRVAKHTNKRKRYPMSRIVRAVSVLYVPQGTCLTKALAGYIILSHEGYSVCLQIGVAKDQNGKFVAHAWIESDGRVIIGGNVGTSFIPIYQIDGQQQVYKQSKA